MNWPKIAINLTTISHGPGIIMGGPTHQWELFDWLSTDYYAKAHCLT